MADTKTTTADKKEKKGLSTKTRLRIIAVSAVVIPLIIWISTAPPPTKARVATTPTQVAQQQATVISRTQITISESWSSPEIYIGADQSAEIKFIADGWARSIEVMDADYPGRGIETVTVENPSVKRHMYRPIWRARDIDQTRPLVLVCTVMK